MSSGMSYQEYVTDNKFAAAYSTYQERYAEQPRESDKQSIELVKGIVSGSSADQAAELSLLDIGCSTGNLLYHLKKALPGLHLNGADLMENIIRQCRTNPRLEGIQFEVMDMLHIQGKYDIIVGNAITYLLSYDEFDKAMVSISKALKTGGWYFAFEWFHPYEQDLNIIETSKSHTDGLNIHSRPYPKVRTLLERHGFANIDFIPFVIPIDLPKGQSYGDNKDGVEDLNSYTVKNEAGERMLFRGSLFQPWCHLRAQKLK